MALDVDLSVHSDGLNQATFQQGCQIGSYLVEFCFWEVSSTGQSEALIEFELICAVCASNFGQVLLNFDIFIALQQVFYLLHYLSWSFAVS